MRMGTQIFWSGIITGQFSFAQAGVYLFMTDVVKQNRIAMLASFETRNQMMARLSTSWPIAQIGGIGRAHKAHIGWSSVWCMFLIACSQMRSPFRQNKSGQHTETPSRGTGFAFILKALRQHPTGRSHFNFIIWHLSCSGAFLYSVVPI